jgi:hypothetical protein
MRLDRAMALLFVSLAACQSSRSTDAGVQSGGWATEPSRPMAASIVVRDGNGVAGPFRLDELDRLTLEVKLIDAPAGSHQGQIDVLSPEGTLFGQLPVDLEVAADGTGASTLPVEVRGTSIESLRRLGTWHFAVSLGTGPALASAEAQVTE